MKFISENIIGILIFLSGLFAAGFISMLLMKLIPWIKSFKNIKIGTVSLSGRDDIDCKDSHKEQSFNLSEVLYSKIDIIIDKIVYRYKEVIHKNIPDNKDIDLTKDIREVVYIFNVLKENMVSRAQKYIDSNILSDIDEYDKKEEIRKKSENIYYDFLTDFRDKYQVEYWTYITNKQKNELTKNKDEKKEGLFFLKVPSIVSRDEFVDLLIIPYRKDIVADIIFCIERGVKI